MILKTGNSKRGFTLIEVMTATAVLSLGTVLIYEAFFISLDSYSYYANYLEAIPLADEKIWQAQNELSRFGSAAQIEQAGNFLNKNKDFSWNLNYELIEEAQPLYRINLALSWHEGRRRVKLLRTAYACYEEKE